MTSGNKLMTSWEIQVEIITLFFKNGWLSSKEERGKASHISYFFSKSSSKRGDES